jgi:hypothetical protein
MRANILKVVLSAIMLFGAVAINAAEDEAWLQSGSLTERTENWTQKSSLRGVTLDALEEDETPPGEPWDDGTVGGGIGCLLAATGIYGLYKRKKTVFYLKYKI